MAGAAERDARAAARGNQSEDADAFPEGIGGGPPDPRADSSRMDRLEQQFVPLLERQEAMGAQMERVTKLLEKFEGDGASGGGEGAGQRELRPPPPAPRRAAELKDDLPEEGDAKPGGQETLAEADLTPEDVEQQVAAMVHAIKVQASREAEAFLDPATRGEMSAEDGAKILRRLQGSAQESKPMKQPRFQRGGGDQPPLDLLKRVEASKEAAIERWKEVRTFAQSAAQWYTWNKGERLNVATRTGRQLLVQAVEANFTAESRIPWKVWSADHKWYEARRNSSILGRHDPGRGGPGWGRVAGTRLTNIEGLLAGAFLPKADTGDGSEEASVEDFVTAAVFAFLSQYEPRPTATLLDSVDVEFSRFEFQPVDRHGLPRDVVALENSFRAILRHASAARRIRRSVEADPAGIEYALEAPTIPEITRILRDALPGPLQERYREAVARLRESSGATRRGTPEEFFQTLKEIQYNAGGPSDFIERYWPTEFIGAASPKKSRIRRTLVDPTCFHCGVRGHVAADCSDKKAGKEATAEGKAAFKDYKDRRAERRRQYAARQATAAGSPAAADA